MAAIIDKGIDFITSFEVCKPQVLCRLGYLNDTGESIASGFYKGTQEDKYMKIVLVNSSE